MSKDNLLEILRNNGDLNDVKPNLEFIENIITEPTNNELKRCPFCGNVVRIKKRANLDNVE